MIFASTSDIVTGTSYAVAVIVIIVAGIVTYRANRSSISTEEYEKLADAQEKRIKFLEDGQKEYKTRIDYLEGQVNVLKNLPLKELADAQKALVSNQEKIVNMLDANRLFYSKYIKEIPKQVVKLQTVAIQKVA